MPRGIPVAGFRNINPNRKPGPKPKPLAKTAGAKRQRVTDKRIAAKLDERFRVLETMVRSCIKGESRSLVVSGPGGVGKSFHVDKVLKEWDPKERHHRIISGVVRSTHLYKNLFDYRAKGNVVVFDDSDSIFYNKDSLSILRVVCDTTRKRRVIWGAETKMVSGRTGEDLPTEFEFEGTIIFISNLDFDVMIQRHSRLTPYFEALMTRSHYISLSMRSKRDYVVRIHQVVKQGLLKHLTKKEADDVLAFIEQNSKYQLRELSLRMALKIAALRKRSPDWQNIARVTCFRENRSAIS